MKIGIFDSGLGGLVILRELKKKLPQYDYIYLGDTKNLPYGNKSQMKIYGLAVRAVEYLFQQDCELIIMACNTVSSQALCKLQQEYLPKSKYKHRRILGVIRPTAETVIRSRITVGLIGTNRTVDSSAYSRELENVNPKIKLVAQATPRLVPMIEARKLDKVVLKSYLTQFKNINTLILGCTHYGLIKKEIQKFLPGVKIVAQEDLLPSKLRSYLRRHKVLERKLSKHGKIELQVTKINPVYKKLAKHWFGNTNLNIARY